MSFKTWTQLEITLQTNAVRSGFQFLCSLFCAFDFFCFGDLNDSFELIKYGEATNRYREKVQNLNIPRTHAKAPQQKKRCNVSKVVASNNYSIIRILIKE